MKYWVIIEAGAKQRYIFATNKRRATVGASQLVRDVGFDWIDGAIEKCSSHEHWAPPETVVADSGKVNLLVDSHEQGVCLVGQVTSKALRDAPGLDVWGVVHPADPDPANAGGLESLGAAQAAHARVRGSRPSPLLRAPMLPVVRPCRHTAAPAAELVVDKTLARPGAAEDAPREDRGDWVSAQFKEMLMAGNPATGAGRPTGSRARLAELVGDEALADTDQEFTGWVGVVHADGDGVAALFSAINRYADKDRAGDVSRALRDAAESALTDAVRAVTQGQGHSTLDDGGWVLPLIVGGDDVTVLVEGRNALDLAVQYARSFDVRVKQSPPITSAIAAMRQAQQRDDAVGLDFEVPERLAASVGVAIVKPHYPFSDAADLAEALCRSAKAIRGRSSVDLHVLFDSVHANLRSIRAPLRVTHKDAMLRLWGGPYGVQACDQSECGCDSVDHLLAAVALIRPDPSGTREVSSSLAHHMRQVLTGQPPWDDPGTQPAVGSLTPPWADGDAALARARKQAKLRSPGGATQLSSHLTISDSGTGHRSRWLDALALCDVIEGVPSA